jgi:hypothetical protein
MNNVQLLLVPQTFHIFSKILISIRYRHVDVADMYSFVAITKGEEI